MHRHQKHKGVMSLQKIFRKVLVTPHVSPPNILICGRSNLEIFVLLQAGTLYLKVKYLYIKFYELILVLTREDIGQNCRNFISIQEEPLIH